MLLECIENLGSQINAVDRAVMQESYLAHRAKGFSEYDASIEALSAFHKELLKDVNEVRRQVNVRPVLIKKSYDLDGLTLWREPNETEMAIDLKAIYDSYESGKAGLAQVVLQIRAELIEDAVREAFGYRDRDIFQLTLAPPKNAYKLVEREISKAVSAGRQQIAKGAKNIEPHELKGLIDTIIRALVELTIARIVGEVSTAAQNIFTALRVLGLSADEIEARMREDLRSRSDDPFTVIASQAINRAVNEGRRDEMIAREDDIDHYLYSAILDKNTCSPCEDWDGATASNIDQLPDTPNPECEGWGNCRCFIISVFASEEV